MSSSTARRSAAAAQHTPSHNDVIYLLRRTGFGPSPAALRAAATRRLATTVDVLVDYEQVPQNFVPPPSAVLVDEFGPTATGAMPGGASGMPPLPPPLDPLSGLSAWWLQRMLDTSHPLQEKMTLFWHGHFATGMQKVRSTRLMYQQNQLFRENALGRFDELLSAVAQDPAMLIWLDGRFNSRLAPNENWGREVMELFTLGHGNYTEDDVHANSRAFTGWRLTPDLQAYFVPGLFDGGSKTLLGQTGPWGAADAVRILAAHPATGPFLATKLWRFFASDVPPAAAIHQIATVYYQSDHSIREMVRTLFTLPEFYSAATRAGHFSSPAEFIVGTLLRLGVTAADVDFTLLPGIMTALGQQLFNPPNVGGWPGGGTWITAATMLARFNFAAWLTGDAPRPGFRFDPAAIPALAGARTMDQLVYAVADTLGITLSASTRRALTQFAGKGATDSPELETRLRGLVHLALVSPEYQVL